MKNNIILISENGNNKAEGKIAQKLNKKLYNVIQEVEKYTNMDINTILETFGERKLKNAESVIIKKLARKENVVISIREKALATEENITNLKQNGIMIWNIEELSKENLLKIFEIS